MQLCNSVMKIFSKLHFRNESGCALRVIVGFAHGNVMGGRRLYIFCCLFEQQVDFEVVVISIYRYSLLQRNSDN